MSDEPLLRRKAYLFAGLGITCLFSLWVLTRQSTSLSPVITTATTNKQPKNVDIMYQELPAGKTMCSSDAFNNGSWVHQSIGLESNTIDGISSYAGYHCNWDFPHRCYRRTSQLGEFNRSKAM
jgi:hypothetical protein